MVGALIGPRIRERRRAQGMTQSGLARAVGISASYLNLIEHNKRSIAGRTLNAIANQLGMAPSDLSDAGAGALLDQMRAAAAAAPEAGAEVARMTEMAGRFPGWARLIATLRDTADRRERTITALSDRLTHDPFLSETMHLMLSAVTAMQATTAILEDDDSLTVDERARFIGNVAEESRRLARTAQDLVAYFDTPLEEDGGEDAGGLPEFWRRRGNVTPELEVGAPPEALLDEIAPQGAGERAEALRVLGAYARMAAALPLADALPAAAELNYDPVALARRFGAPVGDALRRIGHFPPAPDAPDFGLIECDASGGVLHVVEGAGLPLPRQGGACPLWPLYTAFGSPGQPVRAIIETPDGARRLAWAMAEPRAPAGYAPPPATSVMLFTDAPRLVAAADGAAEVVAAGPQCSICPRPDCGSRRALFLLA